MQTSDDEGRISLLTGPRRKTRPSPESRMKLVGIYMGEIGVRSFRGSGLEISGLVQFMWVVRLGNMV